MSETHFEIDIVQFMRPDGRQNPQKTDLPIRFKEAYDEMLTAGCRFEAEVLTTNEVSITITHPEHGDLGIEIIPNGPKVPEAMNRLMEERPWERIHRYEKEA